MPTHVVGGAGLMVCVAGLFFLLAVDDNTVEVVNRLQTQVTVSCKSADAVIDPKNLQTGESVAFGFKPRFWKETHFSCTASRDAKEKKFSVYGGDGGPELSKIVVSLQDDGIFYADQEDIEKVIKLSDW